MFGGKSEAAVAIGAGKAGLRSARTLVENTLYLADEHADATGHWGTVHSAMRSGLRAASQVLNH